MKVGRSYHTLSKPKSVEMIRIVELGPFGCRIDRGTAENLEDLPEGYEAKGVEDGPDAITVYVEPKRKGKP
jgi:hypothetical protein